LPGPPAGVVTAVEGGKRKEAKGRKTLPFPRADQSIAERRKRKKGRKRKGGKRDMRVFAKTLSRDQRTVAVLGRVYRKKERREERRRKKD